MGERGPKGESHPVSADQNARGGSRQFGERKLGQLFLAELHPRAHQLVPSEHDDEIAPVGNERERVAAGDLRGGQSFAGKHGDRL